MNKVAMEIVKIEASGSSSGAYVMVLSEKQGARKMSLIIGAPEAQAIAIEMEKMRASRPLTHDLFKAAFTCFGLEMNEVIIHNVVEGIFYAWLVMSDATGKTEKIDSRTSDAVALAYRFDCPIYCEEAVLAEVGITPEDLEVEFDFDDDISEEEQEKPATTLADLQAALDEALDHEDYERASKIRDEIERLKG